MFVNLPYLHWLFYVFPIHILCSFFYYLSCLRLCIIQMICMWNYRSIHNIWLIKINQVQDKCIVRCINFKNQININVSLNVHWCLYTLSEQTGLKTVTTVFSHWLHAGVKVEEDMKDILILHTYIFIGCHFSYITKCITMSVI